MYSLAYLGVSGFITPWWIQPSVQSLKMHKICTTTTETSENQPPHFILAAPMISVIICILKKCTDSFVKVLSVFLLRLIFKSLFYFGGFIQSLAGRFLFVWYYRRRAFRIGRSESNWCLWSAVVRGSRNNSAGKYKTYLTKLSLYWNTGLRFVELLLNSSYYWVCSVQESFVRWIAVGLRSKPEDSRNLERNARGKHYV